MALRSRVSNRKQMVGGHKRNKNPKLSPFQREVKRGKLANQPPTQTNKASDRDFPKKARALVDYLNERKARDDKKKEEKKARKQNGGVLPEGFQHTPKAHGFVSTGADADVTPAPVPVKKNKNKFAPENTGDNASAKKSDAPGASSKPVKPTSLVASLNSEVNENRKVARYDEEKMAAIHRKKQKKQNKKKDKKHDMRLEQIAQLERKLEKELGTKAGKLAKKKRQKEREMDPVEAETLRLTQLQKDRAMGLLMEDAEAQHNSKPSAAAAAKSLKATAQQMEVQTGFAPRSDDDEEGSDEGSDDDSDNSDSEDGEEKAPSAGKKRKRISFDESVETPGVEEHLPMRYPKDQRRAPKPTLEKDSGRLHGYEERVDLVRFGDRVEAPPVFDTLPKAGTLADRGEKALIEDGVFPMSQTGGISLSSQLPKKKNKLEAIAQQKGSKAGLYEHKKLVKLGLVKAATQAEPLDAGDAEAIAKAAAQSKKPQVSQADKAKEMEALRSQVMASYKKGKTNSKGANIFKHSFPADA